MNVAGRLNETVSRKTTTATSSYGDPTYGSATTFAARVERTSGVSYSAQGSALQYTHRMFSLTSVDLTDLVFFSEDNTSDNNTGHRPASVTECRNMRGAVSHYEVLF